MQSIYTHKQTTEQPQGMTISHALPQDLDRHTALRLWLMISRNTITALAARIGISQGALSWGLKKDTMPVDSHKILVEAGVPVELLPRPEDVRPGPKPKTERQ